MFLYRLQLSLPYISSQQLPAVAPLGLRSCPPQELRNHNSQNPSLASLFALAPQKGWLTANPVLGRPGANMFSCCWRLHTVLLICRSTKGRETPLYHHPRHSPGEEAALQRTKKSHPPYRCREMSLPLHIPVGAHQKLVSGSLLREWSPILTLRSIDWYPAHLFCFCFLAGGSGHVTVLCKAPPMASMSL